MTNELACLLLATVMSAATANEPATGEELAKLVAEKCVTKGCYVITQEDFDAMLSMIFTDITNRERAARQEGAESCRTFAPRPTLPRPIPY